MKATILLLLVLISMSLFAQEEVILPVDSVELHATLLEPEGGTQRAVLIIPGSGPTDRDGNTLIAGMKNNSLKMLAEALTAEGFATLRIDKRGIGKSSPGAVDAKALRFTHFIQDAQKWIGYLNERYHKVSVIGHSQGGLVGMIAAQHTKVDRFISLSGMSEDAHTTVKRQLAKQPPFVTYAAYPILDSLQKGVKVDSVPPYLKALFNPDIQDFFISFMQYDPQVEIKKLSVPILVVQGAADLQLTTEAAETLSQQNHLAKLSIIDSMSHVLKKSSMNLVENQLTYRTPDLPLHEALMPSILKFLKEESWYLDLYALLGTWQVQGHQRFETWRFDKEQQAFIGEGYKMEEGEKQLLETLIIKESGEDVVYIATVSDQNQGKAIPFALKKLPRGTLSFENLSHDFPKKILYHKVNGQQWEVKVRGKKNEGFEMGLIKIFN